jgi:hypothetical protein
VWVVADELMMPAMGLSRGPRQLPLGVHAYALAGHWVCGVTVDSASRYGTGRSREHTEGRTSSMTKTDLAQRCRLKRVMANSLAASVVRCP